MRRTDAGIRLLAGGLLATLGCQIVRAKPVPMRPDPAVYYPVRSGAVLGDTLGYLIRAEHAEHLWLAVGDTLDAVLERLSCQDHWCRRRPGVVVTRWTLEGPRVAELLPLADPKWRFGTAAAGVQLVAHTPGVSSLIAQVPESTFQVPIFVVPRTDRVRISPHTVTLRTGDTAWISIAALDAQGVPVAYLPHPFWGGHSTQADSAGRVGLVLGPGYRGDSLPFVLRLGRRRADTLFVRVLSP